MSSLVDNIWWTRKARIVTERRLLSNAFHAQVLLLWYSFSGVAASIYYLPKANAGNDLAGITWIIFSVLVLALSGFINGLTFKERAGLIKECYETLKELYETAKAGKLSEEDLNSRYKQILEMCENHSDNDYYTAMCEAYLTHPNPSDPKTGLNRKPTKYIWWRWGSSKIGRFFIKAIFYLIPLVTIILPRIF